MPFFRGFNYRRIIMNSREILVYLSLKYRGDWDEIYSEISLHKEYDEEEVQKVVRKVKSNYVTIIDEDYPESLKKMYKAPFVLFYYGDISLISDTHNKLGVVGTRKPSEYGLVNTEKFVKELSKDFIIISGLAIGIDACAHKTTINNKGKTVAVLGNGLNTYYLNDIEENAELFKEIKKNHLVLTEYPDDVPPDPKYFPIRNRIIAGLCDALLVTEGKIRSGTQITAHLMTHKNGNVCCIPARIGKDSICNALITEGAFLVETPQDVYEVAGVVRSKPIFES